MQNVVRRILGFVTQLVVPAAPADTTAADEAWWQAELKDIEEEHYRKLGDWWMEEVPGKCLSCPQPLRLMRWQQSGYGDQCDKCLAVSKERHEDFLAACQLEAEDEIKDAMSVKISL